MDHSFNSGASSSAAPSSSSLPRDVLMSLLPPAEDGDAKRVGYILSSHPEAAASIYNDRGEHLVHIAAKGGHTSVIDLLTSTFSIPVDILSTQTRQNILHYVAYWGHGALLSHLLTNIDERTLESMLRAKNNQGYTPLQMAALGCQQRCYDLLLAAASSPKETALASELLSSSSQPYCFVERDQPQSVGGPSSSSSSSSSFHGLRLQVASDLHVEYFDEDDPDEYLLSVLTPSAPNLALLGDIGVVGQPKYERFLDLMLTQFERVLVCLGNHEFYNDSGQDRSQWTTMEQRIEHMERFCDNESRRGRLILMNRNTCMIDGVKIIGCTLWSNIPEYRSEQVGRGIDFRRILIADESQPTLARPFSPVDTLRKHLEDVAWIKRELREAGSQPCVVLSHHAPTTRNSSAPGFNTSFTRSGFSSDLEDMFRSHGPSYYPLVAWGFGHTHYNCNQVTAGTRVFSNQRGYEYRRFTGDSDSDDDEEILTISLECEDSFNKSFVLRVPAVPLPPLQ